MGKLTPSEIKFWLNEAKECEERQRRELTRRNNYPFLVLYYEGVERIDPQSPFVNTAEAYSVINEFFPNTNAKISELMYKYPDILATALKPEAEDGENLMKSALNYGFSRADALVENRVALFDMLYAGYCAVEVDHIIDTSKGVENLPTEEEQAKRQEDNKGFIQKTLDKIRGTGGQNEVETDVESEMPDRREAFATNERTYIRRWNPANIPLDYRADVLKERRYNLKKVELSQAEFNAKYPLFKDKITATDNTSDFAKWDKHDHKKKVMLYEFQIKKKNNEYWNLVISPGYTSEEIDLYKRPYIHNGFNVKIGTLHKYGKLYPISFAQINKKLQDEMNHYVKFMMEVAERSVPKYGADKGRIKDDGMEALRSSNINDVVLTDGMPQSVIQPLAPAIVAKENKELMTIFNDGKQKLWNISQSRLQGVSSSNFATEINIQEAGMMASETDIQEGLRIVMKEQLEALKDIIVQFWDGEYFFKVTGGQMPQWYAAKQVVNPITQQPMIVNPLTDILTGDYEIDVDIISAMRPNKEKKKKDLIDYYTWLINVLRPVLNSQGKDISVEEIKKSAITFGLNPETLFIDLQAPMGVNGMPPQGSPQGGPPGLHPAIPPEVYEAMVQKKMQEMSGKRP